MLLASVQRSTTVGLPTDAAPAWFGLHSEALDAYVARAIRLATDKPFYFAEKQKLWSKRSTAPLFDTEVRHRRTKYSMHRSFNITARAWRWDVVAFSRQTLCFLVLFRPLWPL